MIVNKAHVRNCVTMYHEVIHGIVGTGSLMYFGIITLLLFPLPLGSGSIEDKGKLLQVSYFMNFLLKCEHGRGATIRSCSATEVLITNSHLFCAFFCGNMLFHS